MKKYVLCGLMTCVLSVFAGDKIEKDEKSIMADIESNKVLKGFVAGKHDMPEIQNMKLSAGLKININYSYYIDDSLKNEMKLVENISGFKNNFVLNCIKDVVQMYQFQDIKYQPMIIRQEVKLIPSTNKYKHAIATVESKLYIKTDKSIPLMQQCNYDVLKTGAFSKDYILEFSTSESGAELNSWK